MGMASPARVENGGSAVTEWRKSPVNRSRWLIEMPCRIMFVGIFSTSFFYLLSIHISPFEPCRRAECYLGCGLGERGPMQSQLLDRGVRLIDVNPMQ